MAIKFPLKMSDGTLVKTIEDLRDHFDLVSVLGYYKDGRLIKWLRNDFCDKEAVQLENLTVDSSELPKKLCDILGVPFSEISNSNLNLNDIARNTERLNHLKQFTSDETILENADSVAFSQNELTDLLQAGRKKIYLCGDHFNIPGSAGGITYVGVNKPSVKFSEEIIEGGIDFQNLCFDITNYLNDDEQFIYAFKKNLTLGVKLLRMDADAGIADAQRKLGECYYYGNGVAVDKQKAMEWFIKAANQGSKTAIEILKEESKNGDKNATEWLEKEQNKKNSEIIKLEIKKICIVTAPGIWSYTSTQFMEKRLLPSDMKKFNNGHIKIINQEISVFDPDMIVVSDGIAIHASKPETVILSLADFYCGYWIPRKSDGKAEQYVAICEYHDNYRISLYFIPDTGTIEKEVFKASWTNFSDDLQNKILHCNFFKTKNVDSHDIAVYRIFEDMKGDKSEKLDVIKSKRNDSKFVKFIDADWVRKLQDPIEQNQAVERLKDFKKRLRK